MTDPIKFSVTELQEIFEKMPPQLVNVLHWLIFRSGNKTEDYQLIIRQPIWYLRMNSAKKIDLVDALADWNWNSHPPHKDPAILVLVEELLEEYRDG